MRFVLVHGGNHGGWCWRLLVEELEHRGHDAVAVDLPGHGARQGEAADFDGYRYTVLAHLEPDDVVVGHSLGGMAITAAVGLATTPVRHLVYLAATTPLDGATILESLDVMGGLADGAANIADGAIQPPSRRVAGNYFYGDCDPDMVQWASQQLCPEPLAIFGASIDLGAFWTADIPRTYVWCQDDRAVRPEAAAVFAERIKAHRSVRLQVLAQSLPEPAGSLGRRADRGGELPARPGRSTSRPPGSG